MKNESAQLTVSKFFFFDENTNQQSFSIQNSGAGDLEWTVLTSANWLHIPPMAGDGDKTIALLLNRVGLTSRSYNTTLSISSNGGSKTIDIDVQVAQAPPTPTISSVSTTWQDGVRIDWNGISNADVYYLYRSSSSGGNFTRIANSTNSLWSDLSVSQAEWQYYKISSFNSAGESQKSLLKSGYRSGWRRFENENDYNTATDIRLRYNLYACGFRSNARFICVYAVYRSGSQYNYIPGSGSFQKAAYCTTLSPLYQETKWASNTILLNDTAWYPDYRNNNPPKFINLCH